MHCDVFSLHILACPLSFALHSSLSKHFYGQTSHSPSSPWPCCILRNLPVCWQRLMICLSGRGFLIWARAVTYGITLFSETANEYCVAELPIVYELFYWFHTDGEHNLTGILSLIVGRERYVFKAEYLLQWLKWY